MTQVQFTGEEPRLRASQFVLFTRIIAITCLLIAISELVYALVSGNTPLCALAGLTLAIGATAHLASLFVKANRLTVGVYTWSIGLAFLLALVPLVATSLLTLAVMGAIVNVVTIALFLSPRHVKWATAAAAIFVVLSTVLEKWTPWQRINVMENLPWIPLTVNVASVVLTAYLINLSGATLLKALDSSQAYAAELEQSRASLLARTAELAQRGEELEQMNQELHKATQQAEHRVAQLAARGQVTRAANQIRDLNQLLPQVTHLISQAFGYYHVGIFVVDETGRYAVLRAANSEGGQRMLARGHKVEVGTQSIVGSVTSTGQPRVALGAEIQAAQQADPDLFQTRSEMALPLRIGDRTFGALDMHSIEEAAFSEDDVAVLSALADQIATTIENARLLEQTRAALHNAEEAQRIYLRQGWERLLPTLQSTRHEYHASGVAPVGNAPLPEIEQVIQKGDVVTVTSDSQAAARSALAVPIKLRDQLIGVIDLHEADAEREWTAEDVALVTAVADQAALALENARLLEQTEQHARREQLVTQIATKVRVAADVEGILRTGVQEIRRVLGASHGIIHLTTESQSPIKEKQKAD
jgi:GAF domain-containing protein